MTTISSYTQMIRLFVSLLGCMAIAAAQKAPAPSTAPAPVPAPGKNAFTVPLSDPAKPAAVKARLVSGSMTVTAGSGPQVVVDSEPSSATGANPTPESAPSGMHRIDTTGRGFKVEEDHNTVTIGADRGQSVNLLIQVPANASLDLRTVNGAHIDVTGIGGDLDVEDTNGSIVLTNVSGAVSARTVNGSITATLDRTPPGKPMSFSSLNGKIDVTLPAETKARLRLKASNGAIYSDFDVKMEPDGTRSINGGGPEYSF